MRGGAAEVTFGFWLRSHIFLRIFDILVFPVERCLLQHARPLVVNQHKVVREVERSVLSVCGFEGE